MAEQFDIAIVGGAITGSVLSLALSSATSHKIRIAIIEKSIPNFAEQGGFDARSIALAYGSLQKLAKIQSLVGQNLVDLIAQISTPIHKIHVSDQGHFGKTHIKAEELHLPQLGTVVELAKLGEKLNNIIAQHQNITLFCPNTVEKVERSNTHCTLTLANQEVIECKLVVAADGIQSQIAQKCGVETVLVKEYNQSAIIANVELSESHQNQAFERFTTQGPFALLPLTEKTMSLVWCMNDTTEVMDYSDDEFLQAIQQQFGWKLGKFSRVSKRFVYPLSLRKSQSHIHHRLAIVGNASQFLHPVAGQGFNLGMRDLFELATLVGTAFNQQQDIGDQALLSTFNENRQADQERIMRSTSGLISIFCCEFLPVQVIRNLGLLALNPLTFARHKVAHRALGW
ncbi:2-octaprenyl-6-methoxyphenyl hydroxylase [Otariodibacter oris]|uniref:2-octaprenyl-6-methoxyphenol hydroxylase n=1 Tax=Otariodibacter oris TaxID=1032623 RepID=A0A420XJD2_9PAST|nr:2-octaprenyl-6-methoxyphenyl hydroxylase [Otariodibacter oris]QGM80486.1 2-octaprenyl-6-methoxyphenyl hydroxylase [Otariodibacter oris]RKR77366.1 2-octaprenyl-6-methoxyphenol hydroxylase [Otariodibacter oris]